MKITEISKIRWKSIENQKIFMKINENLEKLLGNQWKFNGNP